MSESEAELTLFERLMAYLDKQKGIDGGAYDPTPVLHQKGVSGVGVPEALQADTYNTRLMLPGDDPGRPSVEVHTKGTEVALFTLELGLQGTFRITPDSEYDDEHTARINARLSAAGL